VTTRRGKAHCSPEWGGRPDRPELSGQGLYMLHTESLLSQRSQGHWYHSAFKELLVETECRSQNVVKHLEDSARGILGVLTPLLEVGVGSTLVPLLDRIRTC
jgi:hypothetical protein